MDGAIDLLDWLVDSGAHPIHHQTFRGRPMGTNAPPLNYQSKIASLRQGRQVSQRELSEAVGVSENTIASWERSIPSSFVIAFKICDYFEEEIAEFFGSDDIQALKNIETLRLKRLDGAISQRELARELDVTENTVSTWETGKHKTVQKLEKLCQSLNCSLVDIYDQAPKTPSGSPRKRDSNLPARLRCSAPKGSEQMRVLILRIPLAGSERDVAG